MEAAPNQPVHTQTENKNELQPNSKWKEFIDSTTLHGFKKAFENTSRFRQCIWLILFFSAFSYASARIYCSIIKYYTWPESISSSLEYFPKMEFPAITFCNSNKLPKDLLEDEGALLYLHALMTNTRAFTHEEFEVLSRASTGKNGSSLQALYFAHLNEVLINDSVVKCSWNGNKCSPNIFSKSYSNYGMCWTFNRGIGNSTVLEVGSHFSGLEIVLNVHQEKYPFTSEDVGFRVLIHEPGKTRYPFLDGRELLFSPGVSASVRFRKMKLENLQAPYKTKCGEKHLEFDNAEYSLSHCAAERFATFINRRCSCRYMFFTLSNRSVCSLNETIDCLVPAQRLFLKGTNGSFKCPIPCNTTKYVTHVSSLQYPSSSAALKFAKRDGINGSDWEKIQYYRSNHLKLRFFYSELSVQTVKQQPAYDELGLFGDIGGQIGLFVGASVLTVAEFLDFMISLLVARFYKRNPTGNRVTAEIK